MRLRASILSMSMLLSGCATSYVYEGTIEAQDSAGVERQFLVYWSRTERPLWYDTAQGGVRLLSECSPNVLVFEEREDGIVFRRRPEDRPVEGEIPLGGACGRVTDADRITDLEEGILHLTIRCEPQSGEFNVANRAYLRARETVYMFPVGRTEVDDLETATPERPECRNASR